MPDRGLPIVAVVGRPNVGKSTLVNRIIGSRQAVVDHRPGVTRDRREFQADWAGKEFLLVDTGGWEAASSGQFASAISAQAEAAIRAADVVLLVLDNTTAITEEDSQVAEILRSASTDIPVFVIANKADHSGAEHYDPQIWKLGLGDPYPISALHGRGIGELLDDVVKEFPEPIESETEDTTPRLALVGRPNVGKSTLFNRMVGEERVIVSDVPGTTRDPIDTVGRLGDLEVVWVDTAGIRRNPKIKEEPDFYSVGRAREAVKSADVVLLLIDATEGITHQDQRIADSVKNAGVGLVILLNKWDLVDEESRERVESDLGERFQFVEWAPVLRISALTGARVHRISEAVEMVLEERSRRVPTPVLNRLVRGWTGSHPPPLRKGLRPRILYGVQAAVCPPTFVWFISGGDLGSEYLRFLEGRIRSEFGFLGTPIHMVTRRRQRKPRQQAA